MITRMKAILVILGLSLLMAAVDGGAHVSAVNRRGADAPAAAASGATTTANPTRVADARATPTSRAVPSTVPVDGRQASLIPIPLETAVSPTASPVARDSEQRSISSEPGIGTPEQDLRDSKFRAHTTDCRPEGSRPEPASTPHAANAIDRASNQESVSPVEAAPVATSQPPTPVPTPATPSPSSPSNVGEGRWIDVDVTHQLLTAYEGRARVRSVAVSTGLAGTPTPVGQFRIWVKLRYDDMEGPGYYLPDVPYTMYFHGGYGLHGTYWHSNFGHPMSHGCVNLPTPEAEWLFAWADLGTLVNVHN